jgi:hypothetical protein
MTIAVLPIGGSSYPTAVSPSCYPLLNCKKVCYLSPDPHSLRSRKNLLCLNPDQ